MHEQKSQINIGRIGAVYGVRGWMKIISYTRPKENIFNYSPWYVYLNNTWQQIEIEAFQQRGERLLVKLADIGNPEKAHFYTNCDIVIKREQLPDLNEDEYYWHDLIGFDVFNQDEISLGKIREITETGANDVLIIRQEDEDKKNILIPLVMDVYVKQVDLVANKIQVDWQLEK